MPWLSKTMKDVISCDKPRGGANNLRSVDLRIGKPFHLKNENLPSNREKKTRGTETSKYPEEKKTIVIPLVVASERGTAQILAATAAGRL